MNLLPLLVVWSVLVLGVLALFVWRQAVASNSVSVATGSKETVGGCAEAGDCWCAPQEGAGPTASVSETSSETTKARLIGVQPLTLLISPICLGRFTFSPVPGWPPDPA